MKRTLAIVLVSVSSMCFASPIYRQGGTGNYLRLLDTPCPAPDKADRMQMPASLRPEFKAAVLHWNDHDLKACYLVRGEMVYSIDEDGDVVSLPLGAFQEETI